MPRYRTTRAGSAARPVRALLFMGLAAFVTGCESLLEVEPEPHTVPGDELDKPTSLQGRMIGAEANFFLAYDMAIVFGGLYTDEVADPGNAIDERRVTEDNGLIGSADENEEGIDGLWTPMQRAAFTSNAAQAAILSGTYGDQIPDPAESPEYARMSLFAGYSKLVLGELFCSTAFNGEGPEFSSLETYALAEAHFTAAIDAANAEDDIRYAALVARARARLHQGDTQGALADGQAVPAGWLYLADVYSNNSQVEENDIWNMITDSQRYTVAPDFRDLTIDDTGEDDPRIDVFRNPDDLFAIDGATPLYQARKYDHSTAPVRLASYYEAQYIIAEIRAAEGDLPAAVAIINAVRADHGITQEYPGGTQTEVLRKVLDEKSRTLFLEGQRMGDLRRFLASYGIDEFPVSPTPELAGTCMPLPSAERENNPGI
ncbi:MAG: RagB/SusD family nutrient uptake outer membrane protein [Longimicrobiales bacterium]